MRAAYQFDVKRFVPSVSAGNTALKETRCIPSGQNSVVSVKAATGSVLTYFRAQYLPIRTNIASGDVQIFASQQHQRSGSTTLPLLSNPCFRWIERGSSSAKNYELPYPGKSDLSVRLLKITVKREAGDEHRRGSEGRRHGTGLQAST